MMDRGFFMKRITNVLIEDSDYELLEKVLPDNPCDGCGAGVGCCGCPSGKDYGEKVKLYKDAGIYEVAMAVKRINTAENKMTVLQKEIKKECGYLREQGFDLNRLFGNKKVHSCSVKKLKAF